MFLTFLPVFLICINALYVNKIHSIRSYWGCAEGDSRYQGIQTMEAMITRAIPEKEVLYNP